MASAGADMVRRCAGRRQSRQEGPRPELQPATGYVGLNCFTIEWFHDQRARQRGQDQEEVVVQLTKGAKLVAES
jgi:hypothetical protein